MQKLFKITLIALLAGFFTTACDNDADLPYPLEDVERGVLIDISRKADSDVSIDATAPGVQPKLGVSLNLVPKGEGPWDKLNVVVVYHNSVSKTFSKYVYLENVTSLPLELDLDYSKILNGLGIESVNPGDNFHVVVDIYLPNGIIAYGWTPYTGFTNTDFTSWQYNGRGFSRRVIFPAN